MLRVFHQHAGRVTNEIVNLFLLNYRLDAVRNSLREFVQSPKVRAKSIDVTDRTHGDFKQTGFVSKRLSVRLGLHDIIECRLGDALWSTSGQMARVLAADPGESKIQKQFYYLSDFFED